MLIVAMIIQWEVFHFNASAFDIREGSNLKDNCFILYQTLTNNDKVRWKIEWIVRDESISGEGGGVREGNRWTYILFITLMARIASLLFTMVIYMVCIDHRHWSHWTAVWLQLHVSLVHVSACSFAVSQASDLALLVGYVA